MKKERILLIGFGRHALQAHLVPIRQNSNVEIAGIVHLKPSKHVALKHFPPATRNKIEQEVENLRNEGIPIIEVDPFEERDELVACTCSRIQGEIDTWFQRWSDVGIQGFNGHQPFSTLVEPLKPIDGVIVATFGISHYLYARWAIEQGYHTLIDKPITSPAYCSSREEAAKRIVDDYFNLVSAARRKGVEVVIGTHRRYSQCFTSIREAINSFPRQSEEMVNFVGCFTSDGWFAQPDDEGKPYRGADPKVSGGGKLMHTGYHWLDIVPWLLKETVIKDGVKVKTNAMFERYAFKGFKSDNLEKNAVIQVALRQGNGKTCLVNCSLLHEGFKNGTGGYGTQTDQEQLNVYQGPLAVWHRRFEYVGNRGRETETLVQRYHPSGTVIGILPAYDSDKTGPTVEFLEYLVKGKQPCVSPIEDHVIGVLLMASAYLSAIENRAVEFIVRELNWYLERHQRDKSLRWLFKDVPRQRRTKT